MSHHISAQSVAGAFGSFIVHTPSPERVKDWELVELIAEGELAQTYRARPAGPEGDRPPAYVLKRLRREWEKDPRAVQMFRREARLGQSIHHPNLISVLAAGVKEAPYFVVGPWLAGQTLAERLGEWPRLDLPIALWIARQTANALGALAEAGWMHGDVKPGNIFLSSENHVTLLDLGFARPEGEEGSAVDRCVLGTCNYIAPELITSALRADIRSDIYSLGVVLYEMLSGRLPFEGNDLAGLVTQHKQSRAPDLRRLATHVPTGVVRLVREMMAKEPMRRPQTPAELVDRLAKLEILSFGQRSW